MLRLDTPGRIGYQCARRVAGIRREPSRPGAVSAGADATAPPRLEGGAERSVRSPVGECREHCVHRRGGPLEGVGTTPDRTIPTRNRLGTCSHVMVPRTHPVRVDQTPQDLGPVRDCRGSLSGKQSRKVTIARLFGRVLASGMCKLASTRIDRRAERDLANSCIDGLPRLARVLVGQPDQQLGPDLRIADRHVA